MAPQGLDGLMAVDDLMVADNPMVRQYNQRSLHLARQLNDTMDKCYNNKMLEKATMQIRR